MIVLNINPENLDNLTWEQWEIFDSEKPSYREAREIISLFVEGMDKDTAMTALGKLKTSEMKNVFQQFTDKVSELGNVNPTKGGD
jgi:hypothetical protein